MHKGRTAEKKIGDSKVHLEIHYYHPNVANTQNLKGNKNAN